MLANTITISRLVFLAAAIYLLQTPHVLLRWGAFLLVIITLLIDAVDGMIARRRGSSGPLGAVLDIAIDRVVENVFWITFVSLNLVPLWVALVVVTRGILTDAVRGFALAQGFQPFDMMQTWWGRWLVSYRPMRAIYGAVKTITFPALTLLHTLQLDWLADPGPSYLPLLSSVILVLVHVTVLLNLLRGIPVLIESRRLFVSPARTKKPQGS